MFDLVILCDSAEDLIYLLFIRVHSLLDFKRYLIIRLDYIVKL